MEMCGLGPPVSTPTIKICLTFLLWAGMLSPPCVIYIYMSDLDVAPCLLVGYRAPEAIALNQQGVLPLLLTRHIEQPL